MLVVIQQTSWKKNKEVTYERMRMVLIIVKKEVYQTLSRIVNEAIRTFFCPFIFFSKETLNGRKCKINNFSLLWDFLCEILLLCCLVFA